MPCAAASVPNPDADRPDRARLWVLVVLAIVLLAAGYSFVRKAAKGRSAFGRWRPQVMTLIRGGDPYAGDKEFPIPPLAALLLAPAVLLSEVSVRGGALLFLAAKVALTVTAVAWAFRLAAEGGRRTPWWAEALAVALSLRWLVADVTHGNINLLILFCVAGCLYAFRTGREFWSACALAAGVAIKVTPGLFVIYFLWKRQWRLVGLTALMLVVLVLVLPGLVLGFGHNVGLWGGWYDQMIRPFLASGEVTHVQTEQINQSYTGVFYRLLSRNVAITHDEDDPADDEFVNLATLSNGQVRLLLKAVVLVTLGLLAWLCRTPTDRRDRNRLALEYGLIVLSMLFISERSWKHHYVIVVIAHAALAAYASTRAPTRRRGAAVWGGLGVSWLLWMLSADTFGEAFSNYAEAYGVVFWGAVLLWGLCAVSLRSSGPCPEAGREARTGS